MTEDRPAAPDTLALSTKLEEDFVSPLTAVRGALELLRDHPDLASEDRQRFVETALRACGRLQHGIDGLARTVYAAGQRGQGDEPEAAVAEPAGDAADRLRHDPERRIAEIDLSGLEFSASALVNAFYDDLEHRLSATGRRWDFLIDHTGLSVWPEAWIAFAYRSKRAAVAFASAVARYNREPGPAGHGDPEMLADRDAALASLEEAGGETRR